jgi:outer membrane protein G
MKIFLAAVFLLILGFANSQTTAYSGKHDLKAGIGLDLQKYNTLGAAATIDYGLGKVFSVGIQGAYLFKVKEIDGLPPTSKDRFDVKARVNASLGEVFRLPDTMDFYPGLDLGLRNFGGHLGFRYYLDNGIGLFTEGQFVIQKYTSSTEPFNALNNQFAFLVGLTVDLHHEAN